MKRRIEERTYGKKKTKELMNEIEEKKVYHKRTKGEKGKKQRKKKVKDETQ